MLETGRVRFFHGYRRGNVWSVSLSCFFLLCGDLLEKSELHSILYSGTPYIEAKR